MGACAGARATGAIWTGAEARLGAGLLAAAGGLADAGRGAGTGAAAAAGGFGSGAGAPAGGSGVIILTAGVEADVGNSALVGLPVGREAGNAALRAAAAGAGIGAFHVGA